MFQIYQVSIHPVCNTPPKKVFEGTKEACFKMYDDLCEKQCERYEEVALVVIDSLGVPVCAAS